MDILIKDCQKRNKETIEHAARLFNLMLRIINREALINEY